MAATPIKCLQCKNSLFYPYVDKDRFPPIFYFICSRCKKTYRVKNELEKGEPQEDPSSWLEELIP